MRFCATIRRPAFSISALTAPVRLRAVASGLMIEKVRSVAMSFGPQINGNFGLQRLYRRPTRPASDLTGTGSQGIPNNFSEVPGCHGPAQRQHPTETTILRQLRLIATAAIALGGTAPTPTLAADWHGGAQPI